MRRTSDVARVAQRSVRWQVAMPEGRPAPLCPPAAWTHGDEEVPSVGAGTTRCATDWVMYRHPNGAHILLKDLHLLWRHRRWRLVLLSCAVVAAIVAVSGGFRPVGSTGSPLPVSGAGAPVESDAFVVTPLCAWTADVRPGQLSSPDGVQRHLILRARVVSKARDWVAMRAYLDKDVIWLPDGHGDPVVVERSQRADDATLGQDLGPGLPVVLDFVWDLPVGMAPPATSTWGMFKRRFVERSHASGESMWVQDGPGWKFAFPVSRTCPGDTA